MYKRQDQLLSEGKLILCQSVPIAGQAFLHDAVFLDAAAEKGDGTVTAVQNVLGRQIAAVSIVDAYIMVCLLYTSRCV